MGLFLTLIAGLVLWIVLWACGLLKSFDGFLIAMLLVVIAAGTQILIPYLPGRKD
jgi:uncharacterized membrane protein YvlD (DUF360 family)